MARLRIPNSIIENDEAKELSSRQANLSRMEIVKEFEHQDEVIKARAMPQNLSVVASMTNTGVINLYNMPEILEPENSTASAEVKRLRAQLSGLEEESFAVNWNRHQKGLLCSASQQNICVWDTEKSSEPSVKLTGAHVKDINDVNFSAHPAHGGNMMISTLMTGISKYGT